MKNNRIMHNGEEQTIARWMKKNFPFCKFKLSCSVKPIQPFVTQKACEWEIGFMGDKEVAAKVTAETQQFLSTFRLKVIGSTGFNIKQIAFKRQVNVWNNPYCDEVYLYAFGPQA